MSEVPNRIRATPVSGRYDLSASHRTSVRPASWFILGSLRPPSGTACAKSRKPLRGVWSSRITARPSCAETGREQYWRKALTLKTPNRYRGFCRPSWVARIEFKKPLASPGPGTYIARSFLRESELRYATSKRHQDEEIRREAVQDYGFRQSVAPKRR